MTCDVYTRRWSKDLPDVVTVEPGFAVHHVSAGPPIVVAKETLQDHVEEFTESVIDRMTGPPHTMPGARRTCPRMPSTPTTGCRGWPGMRSSTASSCRSCQRSTPWTG